MAVYMIIDLEVKDRGEYARYLESVPEVIQKHGGNYLVRGGAVTPLGGGWEPERIVVIAFETAAAMERCFASDEYLELAPLREQSTVSRSIVVEGWSPADRALGQGVAGGPARDSQRRQEQEDSR